MVAAAVTTVLAVTASGCVTVHGEREVIPSATRAEAGRALSSFVTAYNKADKAYDPALDAPVITGPFGAINQAGLKAKRVNHPHGNENHSPLALTDPEFTIPKMAGWPKFWVVTADSNRDRDGDPKLDNSWMLVFTRSGPDERWKASYLNVVLPSEVPKFVKDGDGLATPVRPNAAHLALPPGKLSSAYTGYLAHGGDAFADGPQTSGWREAREKNASRPGMSTQFIDEPLTDGTYAPVGLRTADGGALVFFSSRHYEKRTAAKGLNLEISSDVRALMTGDAKQSVTLDWVSNQVVADPPKSASGGVRFLSRVEGLTGAKGE
ncbi:hypothetical protein [Streptomyces sp. NPDC050560]|uniref:hypothetical protein n=1 Tax=Streptomyces sp. NPDC050560 TaxID=3365630 RepID=UPI00378D3EFF